MQIDDPIDADLAPYERDNHDILLSLMTLPFCIDKL